MAPSSTLPIPPMEAVRMLLLQDGTAIGSYQRPLRRHVASSSLRSSPGSPLSRQTAVCLVLEPAGHCFSVIDASAFASGALQRYSSASCPSVYIPPLRELLAFRNLHAGDRQLYVHEHHLRDVHWRQGPLPTTFRWRCGGFKLEAMQSESGAYGVDSLDGLARVCLDATGTFFDATCTVAVATTTGDGPRTRITRIAQRFFREAIPLHWAYPASVLIAAHQAHLTHQSTFSIDVDSPYKTTPAPTNRAFSARPHWAAVAMRPDDLPTPALLAVDVYDVGQHVSVPATTLRRPLVAEWTRDASFHVLPTSIYALLPADNSTLVFAKGFFKHYTSEAPFEHCFTLTSVPPPTASRLAYDLTAICNTMAFLHESANQLQPAPSMPLPAVDANAVVEDQTTAVGRFRAFGDGRVRVIFTDRTIVAADAAGSTASLLLPTGVSVSILLCAPPDMYQPYIHATMSFRTWAYLTPQERAATSQRQSAVASRVEAELAKTRACLAADVPRWHPSSSSTTDKVQDALRATQAHLERVQRTLQERSL
ncbi:hypothetical protein SDRG_12644 [Saprolegnia diclina VS20]|uniref:C5orf34-like C-terminal domain-containing protein n=1 Tax=Saprolegnia diclina (strain VS20) TaxID=1156394 RepID=T0Q842_SAPDV|nr:hypothetical protein SDRG_12644 [Saprolegnia diclina VS20]EQC29640.1 hypothetical protein SDRG_12644 [Saprolegnia diclina VS20]|eukprot:XP_008616944.1 hypothetical protein SDRG_12644 [Saprolegnia diclina VS20]